ncbi:Outer membrane usher protein papC precursor [Providencia stuartii]|nr:Outer membrane usher protein papC precursor [Providencia stuartii]
MVLTIKRIVGSSYRLSYSKRFDTYNSQVTFAGYRFSEQGFMSMSEYLDAQETGARQYNSKEMYTISYNQQFSELGLECVHQLLPSNLLGSTR